MIDIFFSSLFVGAGFTTGVILVCVLASKLDQVWKDYKNLKEDAGDDRG